MNESDIQKKVIVTKFVLFKFLFMPFGLTNAGKTFQHLMDSLFHSFPFIFIYLDDILVFSHSHSEHLGHLETACTSILPNVILLNLRLNSWVIWSLPHTSQLTCPANTPITCNHRYQITAKILGMLNFYCRFLPDIAKVLKPLTDATSGTGHLSWTPALQLAFDTAESLLTSEVPLHHPHPSAKLSLAAVASDRHKGAALQQQTLGSWQPLAFFSKKTCIDPNALFYF